jgi:tetratricopeptide (TPR) repeat protein
MSLRGRLVLCGFVLGAVVLGAPVGATPQASDASRLSKNWKQTGTGEIQVLGPVSEATLRESLQEIASFRELLAGLLPTFRVTSPNPIRIFVFPHESAFRRFALRDSRGRQQNVVGYFSALPDLNIIAVAGDDREVVYHEFAHYLLRQNFHSLPTWLSEGLAEFYSTFAIDEKKGQIIVGLPPARRLRDLRQGQHLPLQRVVGANPEEMARLWRVPENIAMFYGESWALVHYLLLGREPKIPGALGRAVAAIEKGTPAAQVLQTQFGVDLAQLDAELRSYLRKGSLPALGIDIKATKAVPAAVQPMTEADARYVQGDLLVRLGVSDDADEELRAALAIDPSHVGARIAAARLLNQQQKQDQAIAALKEIAASTPSSFPAAYYLATALAAEWRHDEAVTAYSKATDLNPESPEAWMGLSVATMALGRTAQANAAMMQATRRQADPDLYRSRAYAALGLGVNEIAAADARQYLNIAGWSSETAVYTAFVGAIAHLRLGQRDEANALLTTAREASTSQPWTLLVADFLDGRIAQADFLSKAKSDGEKTEARTYIGLKAEIDGRKEEAITHFDWVVANGARNYYEYGMARSALKRLKR